MRATKKNIGQISGKVNEGYEIKKRPILNKVNEGDEKKSNKNIAGKKFFNSWNKLGFFRNVFFIYRN